MVYMFMHDAIKRPAMELCDITVSRLNSYDITLSSGVGTVRTPSAIHRMHASPSAHSHQHPRQRVTRPRIHQRPGSNPNGEGAASSSLRFKAEVSDVSDKQLTPPNVFFFSDTSSSSPAHNRHLCIAVKLSRCV